ncbi:MAG TPA: hypothetical protein VJW23_01765, partial [Propionibacteriaceae bacterium]|nr:hypothetical protein [Propionibacteriaceae bacterium]
LKGQEEDRIWAAQEARRRDWVKTFARPKALHRYPKKQMNTMYAYRYMASRDGEPYTADNDTVFLRFDDDIVYVHERAVEELVRHKISSPGICSFPIIINNAICSWWLQQDGRIPLEEPDWPAVGFHCMDPIGWADGGFAIQLHDLLLKHIENDTVDHPQLGLMGHHNFDLPPKQFSVSCFASLGSDYAKLDPPGVLPGEEEDWHTKTRPAQLKIDNTIVGSALVSHYSFLTQWRHFADGRILEAYRTLSEQL